MISHFGKENRDELGDLLILFGKRDLNMKLANKEEESRKKGKRDGQPRSHGAENVLAAVELYSSCHFSIRRSILPFPIPKKRYSNISTKSENKRNSNKTTRKMDKMDYFFRF